MIEAILFKKRLLLVHIFSYKKLQPKIINYRSYKCFCNDEFRASLHDILPLQSDNNCEKHFDNFISSCNNVLDQHAPKKKKYVRGNKSPFINKVLMKAIMLRTKLRNIFLKYKTEESRIKYNQQRNLCVTLLRKSKRNYYNSLNEKNPFVITKHFRKPLNHHFLIRSSIVKKLLL